MSEIQFLNIDLDIESSEDLSTLVAEMSERTSVMRNESGGSVYFASFETGAHGENEIIEEYSAIIEGLSPKNRTLWEGCSKREFDFGYDSGDKPNNFHSSVSVNSIALLARLGGSVVVTIYPAYEENT
jgi:hypothetical protein